MEIRPKRGGFLRPFGTAWFIIEFLKGNAPEGSKRIEPEDGAPMVDICYEYKNALRRVHARNVVEEEEERRVKKGLPAYTEEEYQKRLEYHLARTPYRSFKMRYSSFTRYFGHLKRLGWVEETGETEPSAIQDSYPPAPPQVFYRLTDAGWKATPAEISDPVMTLYQYERAVRSAKKAAPSL